MSFTLLNVSTNQYDGLLKLFIGLFAIVLMLWIIARGRGRFRRKKSVNKRFHKRLSPGIRLYSKLLDMELGKRRLSGGRLYQLILDYYSAIKQDRKTDEQTRMQAKKYLKEAEKLKHAGNEAVIEYIKKIKKDFTGTTERPDAYDDEEIRNNC
ncbi:MAG: hypothetical protein K8S56_08955 [Candidatus Cloacimonetes bacterium]|nr:hypothetical protein [Candidatus Cloacimonadota bacterium]